MRLDFLQRLGGYLLVERGENGLALGRGQVFENVGDIGWVQLRQALMLDLQFHAPRRVDLDHVDKFPGNHARRKFPCEGVERLPGHRALEQSANRATQPDLDLQHAEVL